MQTKLQEKNGLFKFPVNTGFISKNASMAGAVLSNMTT
jgi:hypothetical protein